MASPQERCPGTEGLPAASWARAGWRAHMAATGSTLLHPSSEATRKGPEQLSKRKTTGTLPLGREPTPHIPRGRSWGHFWPQCPEPWECPCVMSAPRGDRVGLRTTVFRVSWSPPSQVEVGVSERCPAGAGKDGGRCQESCGPARVGMNLGPSEARSGGDSFVVFVLS